MLDFIAHFAHDDVQTSPQLGNKMKLNLHEWTVEGTCSEILDLVRCVLHDKPMPRRADKIKKDDVFESKEKVLDTIPLRKKPGRPKGSKTVNRGSKKSGRPKGSKTVYPMTTRKRISEKRFKNNYSILREVIVREPLSLKASYKKSGISYNSKDAKRISNLLNRDTRFKKKGTKWMCMG